MFAFWDWADRRCSLWPAVGLPVVAKPYIKDFDAVLLDAGSTADMIAEEMFARCQFLSVLTNNMGAYAAYTRARTRRGEPDAAEAAGDGAEESAMKSMLL